MDIQIIALEVLFLIGFAALYTFLDRKYKWFRVQPLYNKNIWLNFLGNFALVGVFYLIIRLLGF